MFIFLFRLKSETAVPILMGLSLTNNWCYKEQHKLPLFICNIGLRDNKIKTNEVINNIWFENKSNCDT